MKTKHVGIKSTHIHQSRPTLKTHYTATATTATTATTTLQPLCFCFTTTNPVNPPHRPKSPTHVNPSPSLHQSPPSHPFLVLTLTLPPQGSKPPTLRLSKYWAETGVANV